MTRRLAWLLPLALLIAAGPSDDGFGNPYVPDNIFAKIARGQAPAAIVYRDRDVIAFMDVAPLSPGHVLVVSRRGNARSLIDMPPGDLAKLMAVARRVMVAERDALGASGAAIMVSNGSFQSVPQLHVHVVPAYKGVKLALDAKPPHAAVEDLAPIAAKLAAAMPQR